jgi:hypothetical protein
MKSRTCARAGKRHTLIDAPICIAVSVVPHVGDSVTPSEASVIALVFDCRPNIGCICSKKASVLVFAASDRGGCFPHFTCYWFRAKNAEPLATHLSRLAGLLFAQLFLQPPLLQHNNVIASVCYLHLAALMLNT